MQAFMVLSFVAVASAGRLGYDYQLGVSGSADAPLFTAAASPGLHTDSRLGGSSGPLQQAGSLDSPVIDGGLNKEFYSYSAPEDEFDNGDASQRIASAIKKNLRVVFIKAPENNGLKNAALQIAKQATSDRTAIYVLSKQTDASELANQVQELRKSVNYKPEVRFVKYRTAEDAANAQRSIQQQYDALGGTSHSSNEGIVPVLNYASAPQYADFGGSGLDSNVSPVGVVEGTERRDYLPPIVY